MVMGNNKNSDVFNFAILLKSRKFGAREIYMFYSSHLMVVVMCIEMTDVEAQEYFDNFFEEVFTELEDRVRCVDCDCSTLSRRLRL